MGRPRSRGWQRGVPEDPRQCKSSFSPCGAPRSGIPNSTSHRSPATCWLSECRPLDASGGRGRLKGDKNHTSTTRVCTATASKVSRYLYRGEGSSRRPYWDGSSIPYDWEDGLDGWPFPSSRCSLAGTSNEVRVLQAVPAGAVPYTSHVPRPRPEQADSVR